MRRAVDLEGARAPLSAHATAEFAHDVCGRALGIERYNIITVVPLAQYVVIAQTFVQCPLIERWHTSYLHNVRHIAVSSVW